MTTPDYRRYSNSLSTEEEEEVTLDERCCFGYTFAFVCPVIAGLNFFVDIGAACLSIGSDFIYCFGLLAVFSLLCLGATMSGVQEEQSSKIKLSICWVISKIIILIGLIACLVVAFFDIDWLIEFSHLNLNENVCTALMVFLPFTIVPLIVQLLWSRQMLKIIAIRDRLYTIPCEIGPVPLRNSLRTKRCSISISTVLEPEKY